MSIVGLTKLRFTSNVSVKSLHLSTPPISTRSMYRSYCAMPSAGTSSSGQSQTPTGEYVKPKAKPHNPGVAKMMQDRLRDLEEGLLLRSQPINATKIMFEPKNEDGPYTKQSHYETKSLDRSVKSYRRMYEDVIKIGRGAALGASYKYLISWYEPLWKSIESEQSKLAQDVLRVVQDQQTINQIADSLEADGKKEAAEQEDSTITETATTETEPTETIDDIPAEPISEAAAEGTETSNTETANVTPSDPLADLAELPPYITQLMGLTPQKLAVITMHTCLSNLMQNNGALPFNRIALAVGNAVQAEWVLQRVKLQDKKFFKQLKKKLGGNINVNKLNKHAKHWVEEKWDNKTVTQLGACLISHLIKLAVVDDPYKRRVNVFERTSRLGRQESQLKMHQFILNQVLKDPDVLKEMVSAIYLPMIVPPKPWCAPVNGGYLNIRTTLMRVKDWKTQMGSVIQVWRTTPIMDDLFKSLNSLGKLPWKVNKEVYDVIQAAWDNGGDIADMPNRFDKEIPTSAPANMTQRDYWKLIKKIKLHNNNMNSLRCDLKLKLAVARDFQDEKLFFPHNLDFRGRSYPIPAHLNHMGPDICRSLLMFYEGRPLGTRGLRWLKIHTANLFGKDKLSFDERVQFVESEMDNILDSANNPLGGRRWWLQAEHPWQCLGACFELKKVMECKNPEEYISHLPVHQDGTCNGLQHYAALGGDIMGAQQVNLYPSDRPQDVYAGVARLVTKRLEEEAALGNKLAQSLVGKISRKIVKQTVMTSVYGVTYIGARAQIANAIKDQPNMQEFYSDDSKLFLASSYITKHTFSSLKEMFLGARLIMDWLNQCARVISKTGLPVMWYSPIGVPVVQPYRKEGNKDYVKTVVLEMRLRETHDLPINVTRQRTAFPPNLIHSIDSSHMMLTAMECEKANIAFAAVHDSYWTHAADVDVMNKILRDQFIYLHKQPILEQIQDSFAVNYPHISAKDYPVRPKRGDFNLDEVANSQYFFN